MSESEQPGRVRVISRLVADRGLYAEPAAGHLLAPGLRETTVRVQGDVVGEPMRPDGDGGLLASLIAGREGLRALPRPRHRVLAEGLPHQAETFISDDVFGASRLLMLDELLAELLLVERPTHGCLVVAPNRHLLAVHLLSDLRAVAPAIELLAELALAEHRIAEPVSPWVYYRRPDGHLSLLSPPTGDGPLSADFAAALRGLGEA